MLSPPGKSQSAIDAGTTSSVSDSSSNSPTPRPLDLTYHRPSSKTKLRNYVFDTFGPYPIVGAAFVGAVNQGNHTPPEWGQGFGAYGERVGSDFGIAMVSTTTRFALAAAFREDTIYYRCECKGLFRRLAHAGISTVTARVGEDGHRRLSFPALIAPYAGTMAAVYGWYPSRYGVKDGLRMGNLQPPRVCRPEYRERVHLRRPAYPFYASRPLLVFRTRPFRPLDSLSCPELADDLPHQASAPQSGCG